MTSSSLLLSRRYHSSGIYFKEAFLFFSFISGKSWEMLSLVGDYYGTFGVASLQIKA